MKHALRLISLSLLLLTSMTMPTQSGNNNAKIIQSVKSIMKATIGFGLLCHGLDQIGLSNKLRDLYGEISEPTIREIRPLFRLTTRSLKEEFIPSRASLYRVPTHMRVGAASTVILGSLLINNAIKEFKKNP